MKYFILITILILQNINLVAQPTNIIQSKKAYKISVANNEKNKLVNLKSIMPNIYLDLRYSTTNNFTKTNLYKKATTTYLRYDAAYALKKINDALRIDGFTLKIFDAYRPYAATKLMWELIKDERYVANPKSGSNHNKGLSIDLTLLKLNNEEVDMGTGFDNFTDTAHHSFKNLPQDILQNREKIKSIMEKNGFKALETEWWHYTYVTTENYTVIDLSFKELKKLIK